MSDEDEEITSEEADGNSDSSEEAPGDGNQGNDAQNALQNKAREVASEEIKKAIQAQIKALGEKITARVAAQAAAASSEVWIPALIIGIIILLLILLIVNIVGGSLTKEEDEIALPDVNITKIGPEAVPNKTEIGYTIIVSYPGKAEDIIVTDTVPENTEFVKALAIGNATYQPETIDADADGKVDTVNWSLKEIQNTTPPSTFTDQTLTIILRPTADNVHVVNKATATVYGGELVTGPGSTLDPVPPSTDDCGGYYAASIAKNPMHKNFGDPNCTMLAKINPADMDELYSVIKSLDPKDADVWFFKVIPGESGYNTNAYGYYPEIDPGGAWGLFQMNCSACTSTQYKNGDVNWELQVSNAIKYSQWYTNWYEDYYKVTCPNAKWHYWETAKDLWSCTATP